MHPAAAFRPGSTDAAFAFADAYAFAHIFAATPDGPRVAHAPVLAGADGVLRFHLANANALTPHLDGAVALISIGGPGSYISANWYGDRAATVPTWNYCIAEFEGTARAMEYDDLGDLLDLSAATFEPRVGENWTMDKLPPARRDGLMRAITGFHLAPTAVRMTDKASQNRPEADARAVVAALERCGDPDGAMAIRRTRGW